MTADDRPCPSDDELAAFVEHTASPALRERIERHVDGCADCREAVGHVTAAVETPPRMIDRYRLDSKIGEGGMGQVWRAWDPALERTIAVKLLHPELHDEKGRDRALREARALARLQHPNVVAVYDVGEHEGDVFIATELVDGESMDRWQRGKTPAAIIAAYAQAARGLAAAHELGLVHRDVKPNNILVSRDGRVRVGDFGLATNAALSSVTRKPVAAGASPNTPLPKLTEDGAFLGTPAYMAPEQRETTDVDSRADQYGLCLALAEALLGKMPDRDATGAALSASGIAAPWDAIARGMQPEPQQRFANMDALVAALEPGGAAHRRTRTIAMAAVLGAAAIAVGGIWYANQHPTPATNITKAPAGAPTSEALPWFWTAVAAGPWQVPFAPYDIIVADAGHAIVLGADRFAVVDLTSGAVSVSATFDTGDDNLDTLVAVDGRVLLFGTHVGAPAVWHLQVAPVAATLLPIPDDPTTVAPDEVGYHDTLLSPDGTRLFTCVSNRVPVVRDARTFAILRAYPKTNCLAYFTDNTHLRMVQGMDEQDLDLTTGKISSAAMSLDETRSGPGALRFEQRDGFVRLYDGKRILQRVDQSWVIRGVQWNQRYAVATFSDGMLILPLDAEIAARRVELPETNIDFSLGESFAVATSGRSILRIDLASGRVQKPQQNLAQVNTVAPRGRSVLASSDRLRVWRDGKVIGTTTSAAEIAVGAADAPVALLSYGKLELWNPDTDDRELFQDAEGYSFNNAMVRDGDALVLYVGDRLLRGTLPKSLEPWHQLQKEVRVAAVDQRHERIALDKGDATHVVDLDARRVFSFSVPGFEGKCDSPREVRLSPDGNTVGFSVSSTDEDILLLDTKQHFVHALELDENLIAWQFLPSGEVIAVSEKQVTIWDPASKQAIAWPTPVPNTPYRIGVSPDGGALAVGHDDGSVLWADLKELRTHASPHEMKYTAASLCAPPPPAAPYESLLVD